MHLPFISDCYAINVMNDEEVWLSYYSDFPLVRMKHFELQNIWTDFARISQSFVVRDKTVIYKKAYERNQLLRCSLDNPAQHEPVEAVDENGQTISGNWEVAARGPDFCLMAEGAIYMMSNTKYVEMCKELI